MRIINSDWKKLNVALGRGLRRFTPWSWVPILVAAALLLTAMLWVAMPRAGQAQGAPPAQPTGLTATAGYAQATLAWTDPSDSTITGYEYFLHAQVAKLTASDGAGHDRFGWSVAVDGDTAVVGAHGNDGLKGAAYVLTRQSGAWNQVAKLTAFDGAATAQFGKSVAMDGDTVVVGALNDDENGAVSGSAYVFTKPANGWVTTSTAAKLTASDGAAGDRFGKSVAMDGDTVVVGAWWDDDNGPESGSAYVFTKPANGWVTTSTAAKLTASDGVDDGRFGSSVAVDGDTLVVGASDDDENGEYSGSAYVFTKPANGWVTTSTAAKLTASDGAADDYFGYSVAVDEDTVVVGAFEDDENGEDSGSAYVFTEPTSGGWTTATETAKLTASDGAADDWFGFSVAMDGDTLVVGAPEDDDKGTNSGSAYVYEVSDWTAIPDSAAGETNATSYTVTGLTNGTEYTIALRAVSTNGNGPAATVTATPLFAAPTNLVAAPDSTRILLQWDTGDSGITHYLISSEITDGSGNPPPDKLVTAGSGTRTTADVTSLTNGTEYTFTVRAAAVSGGQTVVVGASSSVNATPTVAVPAAPTNLTATPGDGQVTVTWDNPHNISIRKYQYSADGGATFHHMNGSGRNTTSFTFTGLTNGEPYTLGIRASNLSGESAPTTVGVNQPPDTTGPRVSNLGKSDDGSTSADRKYHAQAFTTGWDTQGYTLVAIEVDLQRSPGDATLTVQIRDDDGSGNPGSRIFTLTNPSELETGIVRFTAPADTHLEPHTKYWLHLAYGGNTRPRWGKTYSDGEDPGAYSGWSIANDRRHRTSSPGTWTAADSSLRVRVNISNPYGVALVSNLGKSDDGSTSADRKYHAQAFTTGGDTQGYPLAAIEVDLQRSPGDATLTVQIRDDDGSGNPGSRIFTLTNPSELETGIVRFTAPADTHLEADTKYWLHLAYGGNTRPRWGKTYSDGEDPGAYSGWSIANDRRHRTSSPGTWTAADSSIRIRIKTWPANGNN